MSDSQERERCKKCDRFWPVLDLTRIAEGECDWRNCGSHAVDWRARALAAEGTIGTLEAAIDAIHQSFNATIEELMRARGWARAWKRSATDWRGLALVIDHKYDLLKQGRGATPCECGPDCEPCLLHGFCHICEAEHSDGLLATEQARSKRWKALARKLWVRCGVLGRWE